MAPSPVAAALQDFVDRKIVAGVVTLVADRTGVLSVDAIGHADIEAGRAMATNSMFWIASNNKPITATALMILVDEGLVDIEAPVEKNLPNFKNMSLAVYSDEQVTLLKKPSRPFTVREVLSHTSGMPFMSRIEWPMDVMTLSEATISYALTPLKAEPGTKYEYSNIGTNIAGRIIEVVSGLSYEKFLQTRLFEPLGMRDTTYVLSTEQEQRLAKYYTLNKEKTAVVETKIGQLTYPLTNPKRQGFPAGGLFSTAADLARFGQMILSGGTFEGRKYLTPKSIRQMTTTQTTLVNPPGDKSEAGYGFCWSTTHKDPTPDQTPDAASAVLGTPKHGGALGNSLIIDGTTGKVMIFLVQGIEGGEGGKIGEAFIAAAKAM